MSDMPQHFLRTPEQQERARSAAVDLDDLRAVTQKLWRGKYVPRTEYLRVMGLDDPLDGEQPSEGGRTASAPALTPLDRDAASAIEWEDCTGAYYVCGSIARGGGNWPSMVNIDWDGLDSGSITADDCRTLAATLLRAADACDASTAEVFADDR